MEHRCIECGFENPPGMRYCGNCGTRLAEALILDDARSQDPVLATADLGVMMGVDLAVRLKQAGLEASGQRRNVTVLFADISGYTALAERIDGEDLYDIVQQYVRILSKNVHKYEGIIDKITGDGLMALFGAPISYENNAERAVRAALDMQRDLYQLSQRLSQEQEITLGVRIGLHSGSVIVGGIGTDLMMDYTAIGDTVNLAHRIEEAAPPGTILISESVYRQVRVFFDCQQISVLNPKGVAQPVIAYRIVGLKSRPGSVRGIEGLQAPMIGRDQELIRLKQTGADLIKNGLGQFVIVTGEAGIGKSRLTAEFVASLDPNSVLILEGQSLAYQRVSYWIIREVLYDYLKLSPSTPLLQVRERLTRNIYHLMGPQAEGVMPYLEHLLALPHSNISTPDRLKRIEAGQLRQQIFLAVREIFQLEANHKPLVILLEDLHWADDASLELLLYLLDLLRKAPIYVLAISREISKGVLERVVTWAQDNLAERFHQIELHSLSMDQSSQLLFLLLSISNLPDKLRGQILMRSDGIPFYLEEITRMLIDEGVLEGEQGQWRVVPGKEQTSIGIPDTLKDLILARFDRLPGQHRRFLQVASVIGKNFSLPLIDVVIKNSGTQEIRSTVDALVERDFIVPQAGTHETEYTFRHILMSNTIYGTMLRKEQSKLHGQVADTIEAMYADRLDEQVELLANHYSLSLKLEKALHYLLLAGQKAARNNANEQSRKQFGKVLEILPIIEHTPLQLFLANMGFGDALVFFGEYSEAQRYYQIALQANDQLDLDQYADERSSVYRKIARTYERQGDYDRALEYFSLSNQVLHRSTQSFPVQRAQIWNDIAWLQYRRGNFAEAGQLLENALILAETTEAYEVIASIYNRHAGVFYNLGDWDKAADFLRKSILLRESIRDVVGLATSFNNLGLLEIEMGNFESALENLTRSCELKTRLGEAEGIAMALNNLGWLRTMRGELDEAGQSLSEALELARQIGYSSLQGEILKNIGQIQLVANNWIKAREALAEAMDIFDELGAGDQLLDTYRLLGEGALEVGDVEAAKSWEGKALALLEAQDGRTEEPSAKQRAQYLCFHGMLATQLGDYDAAKRSLLESREIFEQLNSKLHQGRVAYQTGKLAEVQGNTMDAIEQFSKASGLLREVGAKLEASRAEKASARIKGQS